MLIDIHSVAHILCIHFGEFEDKCVPMTSLVAQTVKRLSTMQETHVRSLGWEDPPEKEMKIYFSILACNSL